MAAPAKKFLNRTEDVVEEMVQGLLACDHRLTRLTHFHVLLRSDYETAKQTQVSLISGGGSGHEPAHAGYIGAGMLTAAVLGGVFASPSATSVFEAIRAVAGPKGVLLIVKNYTGDRLNFGIAAEKARAIGIACEMVIVGDDCALLPDKGITGRRGVAGTVFVHKVAGAAAAAGLRLEQVAAEAREAAAAVGSMGVALTTCTLPGAAPSARLGPDTLEIGLGIHGEPGARQGPVVGADALVDTALDSILSPAYFGPSAPGSDAALLINSLGSTSGMELAVIARRATASLAQRRVRVVRVLMGPYMTSLDMAGFSLSLLLLTPPAAADAAAAAAAAARLARLDAPTAAPAWGTLYDVTAPAPPPVPLPADAAAPGVAHAAAGARQPAAAGDVDARVSKMIAAAAEAIIAAEAKLTEWDRVAGDGDCGETMKRGAARLLEDLPTYPTASPRRTLQALGDSVGESMGGTSGALIQIFLHAAAAAFAAADATWAKAFAEGVAAMQRYGGAGPSQRTMLDALLPAQAVLLAGGGLAEAAAAARAGSEATRTMTALAGRSNYVNPQEYAGVPDPGAAAAAICLEALAATAAPAAT